MKKSLLIVVLIGLNLCVYSQQSKLDEVSDKEVIESPEIMPEYPGGEDALIKFLSSNLIYPQYAMENEIEGTVLAQFVICEDGSLCDLKFIDSNNTSLHKATYEVLSNMPNWTPGSKNGKNVRVMYTLPVTFKFYDEKAEKKSKKKRKN